MSVLRVTTGSLGGQRQELLGAGVTGNCGESNSGPLEEQEAHLTSLSSYLLKKKIKLICN